jgi:hypothetical protein
VQVLSFVPNSESAYSYLIFIVFYSFFSNINNQVITGSLTSSENIGKMAADMVPETGSDRGTTQMSLPYDPAQSDSKDAHDVYIEDGLPPDGKPYGEGYQLPDLDTAQDGEYFRLNYDPKLAIPARLYQFSLIKRKWIYIETDRRGEYTSFKPSMEKILSSPTAKPLGSL